MKKLEEYIAEAYDTKSNKPTVQPKNKTELKKIIKDAFAHKQYDLNFIDTSKIADMSNLFEYCEHDFDVSSWDVSKVKYMSYIFYNCLKFKGKGLENWNVSNVTDMRFMFSGCDRFDCDLSNWDVSNVTYMNGIFSFCYKFEGKGLENWDVSAVNSMYAMFCNCKNFNADLSQWNVSNVTDMKSTFDG